MLKLIGATLIMGAATAIGFYQALLLARRPRHIRHLLQALKRLETEIHYAYTPLPDALRSVARGLSPPIAGLLAQTALLLEQSAGTTHESWLLASDRWWNRTAMKAAERDVWLSLGTTIGNTDRDDQMKHLRLAATHLQAEEQSATEEQKRYESMWRNLGVLGGALLVILMY